MKVLITDPVDDICISIIKDSGLEYQYIPEFKLQNFNMTISEFKLIFWWEWAHRFLGRLIGICFLLNKDHKIT